MRRFFSNYETTKLLKAKMIIRCWGSRGSIPVSGIEFAKYGGDTTCIEIRSENDEIIKSWLTKSFVNIKK